MTQLIKSGKSLAEVQAAHPFADFDSTWGKGFLKPEQWWAMNYLGMKAGRS